MASLSHPRWVIAELDARGSIDQHAAMCLSNALDGALDADVPAIIIDLRALSSIDEFGLALLAQTRAECLVKGLTSSCCCRRAPAILDRGTTRRGASP